MTDGREVKVPLAPLLGACTLVRSMLAESHFHPGIHGPLVISFAVDTDILVSVGDILSMGEANVKEKNIGEVKQALVLLGVKADLSQRRRDIEYEHVSANEEHIKLEIVIRPIISVMRNTNTSLVIVMLMTPKIIC